MSTALVGFAGMTHLGIVSAVATAARGFTIRAYDPDESVAQRLRCRGLPIVEPDLDELVAANQDRLTFTATPSDLGSCNVAYIVADVPSDDQGENDLTPIKGLIGQAADNLQDDAILVLLCQLPPGFTRALTGLPNDRLFCQVETLIFGRAVERALHPERFIVGCADPPRPLPACYREVLEAFGCPVLPMRYESAELAKITINFCLVASITVANVLAEISESIGADWAEIVPALRLDRRIGPHSYLTPGLGIAGGNLERDLRTVLYLAHRNGADAGIVDAWLANADIGAIGAGACCRIGC